jgi:hypothetical protein
MKLEKQMIIAIVEAFDADLSFVKEKGNTFVFFDSGYDEEFTVHVGFDEFTVYGYKNALQPLFLALRDRVETRIAERVADNTRRNIRAALGITEVPTLA